MSHAQPNNRAALAAEINRFKEAWRLGRRPRIEDFVASAPEPVRVELSRFLPKVEAELREEYRGHKGT
ncbi:hypothetical protein ACYOEI_18460, partial [Singulisphaera rosea]